jgi:phenylacetic acid degradation operon negative regulatory protein
MPRADSARPKITASVDRRSKSLILDLYGAYIRPTGGWLAVADLVTLMRVLGVEEQAVRSAVSRMTRNGVLRSMPRDGVSGYELSDDIKPMMDRGDRRIYMMQEPARLEDGWALVVVSVPEAQRDRRYQLRKRLTWLGFGNLANGVWIAPRRTIDELTAVLHQHQLAEHARVFEAAFHGFDGIHAVVESAWDLEWLRSLHTDFLDAASPAIERWARGDADDETAFVDYTVLLHAWRRLPYLDPGLPQELLPPDWEGRAAANTFSEIRTRLEVRARRYVGTVVATGRATT